MILEKEIVFPNCESFYAEIKIKFKKEFLQLNNLKIGDKVKWDFTHNVFRKNDFYTTSTKGIGTLLEDEKGFLFILSDECYMFGGKGNNGRFGNSYKEKNFTEERKATYYFLENLK